MRLTLARVLAGALLLLLEAPSTGTQGAGLPPFRLLWPQVRARARRWVERCPRVSTWRCLATSLTLGMHREGSDGTRTRTPEGFEQHIYIDHNIFAYMYMYACMCVCVCVCVYVCVCVTYTCPAPHFAPHVLTGQLCSFYPLRRIVRGRRGSACVLGGWR
jgi:hypothetical protein